MKKRLLVGLMAGGLMAAMLPGVASAGERPHSVHRGQFPEGTVFCVQQYFADAPFGVVSRTGEVYVNTCIGHLQNQERVLYRVPGVAGASNTAIQSMARNVKS
mgnify:CR=1 FL=1